MYNLTQKLIAEFIGTFALIFFGAGAICVDRYLQGSGGLGLFAIAAAHGLAMAIMVSALGHISGGHFNPAVTIGFWVTKRVSTIDVFLYWAAQLAGATAAAFFLKAVIPDDTWHAVALGTPELARDFPRIAAMALEAVTTFFLVLTVFATAVHSWRTCSRHVTTGTGVALRLLNLGEGDELLQKMRPSEGFGHAVLHRLRCPIRHRAGQRAPDRPISCRDRSRSA